MYIVQSEKTLQMECCSVFCCVQSVKSA